MSLSPIEKIKVIAELKQQVNLLGDEKNPMARIKISASIGELVKKLGGEGLEEIEGAKPEDDSTEDFGSDDPNSPNYRYRDTGYIADSRKEQAANQIRIARQNGTSMRSTDIDWDVIERNPREAKELITKSNLFGQTNWDALKENGMLPEAGFLIDRVYASIAPEPSEDGPQSRKDYAVALETIRLRLEKCITADDVTNVLVEILDELNGSQLNEEEQVEYSAAKEMYEAAAKTKFALDKEREQLFVPYHLALNEIRSLEWEQTKRERRKWKPDPDIDAKIVELKAELDKHSAVIAKFDADHPELKDKYESETISDDGGIVQKTSTLRSPLRDTMRDAGRKMSDIKKAANIRNINSNPVTRGWLTFGVKFFKLLNYRRGGSNTFAGHVTNAKSGKIKDWEWADKERVEIKRATKQEIGFQLKVAETFERKGGKPVNVSSTSDLKKLVGFRDIQSGNWVLDDPNSAKFHVEQTAGAMMDLGDILGIDHHTLGLGGRLGMAFGARGTGSAGWKSGAARAHYESVHRVVNLTKMGGGGSLGHEWYHAIDDMFVELATGKTGPARNFVTYNAAQLPDGILKDSAVGLHQAMMAGNIRTPEIIKITDKDRELARINFTERSSGLRKLIMAAGNLESGLAAVVEYFTPDIERTTSEKWKKKYTKQMNQYKRITAAYYSPGDGDAVIRAKTGPAGSSFFAEAIRLDEGVQGKYWSKPHEMAARAFQSYIEDKLAEADRKNDYLSSYADNKYHFDAMLGIQWNPYPEGEERKRINAAFDKFFAAMRDQKVLENAMENQKLMDAIFGDRVDDDEDMDYLDSISNPSDYDAQAVLDKIIAALNAGKTIMVSTHLKHTKVTPATFKKWNDAGNTLFKTSKDKKSLLMASGKNFVDISSTRLSVYS